MTRLFYGFVGTLCVLIGVVALFVPILPTTPFLILAAWAFSRSSPKLEAWLLQHPHLGPYVRDWQAFHVIPRHAKVLAILMMMVSFAWLWVASSAPPVGIASAGLLMAGVALWLWRQPSHVEPMRNPVDDPVQPGEHSP